MEAEIYFCLNNDIDFFARRRKEKLFDSQRARIKSLIFIPAFDQLTAALIYATFFRFVVHSFCSQRARFDELSIFTDPFFSPRFPQSSVLFLIILIAP